MLICSLFETVYSKLQPASVLVFVSKVMKVPYCHGSNTDVMFILLCSYKLAEQAAQ